MVVIMESKLDPVQQATYYSSIPHWARDREEGGAKAKPHAHVVGNCDRGPPPTKNEPVFRSP